MFGWFWSFLYSLGFFKRNATVLILGLDNAGKTTLIHKLKYGSIHHFVPTQRAQLEDIELGRVKFRTWDLGGHLQVRSLWRDYFVDVDAIIFVVDGSDRERMEESRSELYALLEDENLQETIFLILVNKIDLDDCCSYEEILNQFNISHAQLNNTNDRCMNLFMCSFVKGEGIEAAFSWLSDTI